MTGAQQCMAFISTTLPSLVPSGNSFTVIIDLQIRHSIHQLSYFNHIKQYSFNIHVCITLSS